MPKKKTTKKKASKRRSSTSARATSKRSTKKTAKAKTKARRSTKKPKKVAQADASPVLGQTVALRTKKVRRHSHAIAAGAVRTQPGLELPQPAALARALDIDARKAKVVRGQLEELAKWIQADKKRAVEFRKAPVKVMAERDPDLAVHIQMLHPNLLDLLLGFFIPCCDDLPDESEYADCVVSILERVAQWMQFSSANRAVFKSSTDTAVDAAAPFAPAVAKMLAKQALRTAGAIQGGAA